MPDCASIISRVTAYVDGELAALERESIAQHLRVCDPCRARVVVERAVQQLLSARKQDLREGCAPDSLHKRCAGLARTTAPALVPRGSRLHRSNWSARLAPLALAATLVLIVGAAFVYQLTARSSRVLAAELTADHVKCFALNSLFGTHHTAQVVQSAMASGFGWRVNLPGNSDQAGLELLGSRPCLYGEGKTAHIMYRYHGRPLSVFMLPERHRAEAIMKVFGHEAAIWSVGDRTFVVIGREAPADIERIAAFIRSSIK